MRSPAAPNGTPMRHVLIRAFCLAALASLAAAGNLTIVLEFQGAPPTRSLPEMKREFETLFEGSGLTFDWRFREETSGQSFDNLVVVRFKGKCVLDPVPWLYDERGPLAFTYATAGAVQPFSEVACDQVANAARSAMSGRDFAHADLLFGRALARVMAHELVHILSKSADHGREGVARSALSGSNLISPDLRLSSTDLERIYTQP